MRCIVKIISIICVDLSQLFSYLFPFSLWTIFKRKLIVSFYTGWIKREFKSFGTHSFIHPSCAYLVGQKYITIGDDCNIDSGIQLTAWSRFENQKFSPEIIIGNNCSIGEDAHITAINKIQLGDNVLLGKKVLITDNAHGESSSDMLDIAPKHRPLSSKGAVIIDDNVWIGEKCSIMPNVHIGRGVIVAANSVVTKDVPPFCVVAGIPAKIVKCLNKKNE